MLVDKNLSKPGKEHQTKAKWILKYLNGPSNLCLHFGDGKFMFKLFHNANKVGDTEENRTGRKHN